MRRPARCVARSVVPEDRLAGCGAAAAGDVFHHGIDIGQSESEAPSLRRHPIEFGLSAFMGGVGVEDELLKSYGVDQRLIVLVVVEISGAVPPQAMVEVFRLEADLVGGQSLGLEAE